MLIAAILMGLLALASAMPTLFNASELAVDANISWTGEGIIPVSAMGCREETVPVEEADQAKQKLAKWGGFQHIKPGSWHGEAYGLAGVWICNCKHFHSDHVVPWELDEAQMRIRDWCGDNRAGWLWSGKWQKSITFGTARLMKKRGISTGRCPKWCLWSSKPSGQSLEP